MMRLLMLAIALLGTVPVSGQSVRIKDMGRFLGWRDNPLVGYGIVTGLAGSGDSPRSEVTRQALRNALGRLGSNISVDQLQSRNVAAVTVIATLPPSANVGDRIDVAVSSIGDARSLTGGTLLMTPLLGPDQKPYALAQGQLVVGGYRFDSNFNSQQKNYPTSAIVPAGATVEMAVPADVAVDHDTLTFILKDPDFTTASRIADAINHDLGSTAAVVRGADAVRIQTTGWLGNVNRLIAKLEGVSVTPDRLARVVINERSGTVVAGGDVRISDVVISQGDIKVTVAIDNEAAPAPLYLGGGVDYRGLIVTNTKLSVSDHYDDAVAHFPNSTVSDLVQGLSRAHVNTRAMIAIMQAMKAAGALHAEIIVQ